MMGGNGGRFFSPGILTRRRSLQLLPPGKETNETAFAPSECTRTVLCPCGTAVRGGCCAHGALCAQKPRCELRSDRFPRVRRYAPERRNGHGAG
eukprot:3466641-Prymnesium_polylepis.2